uniref:Glycosyl transferase n=1 Tax=Thermogemmatispora argillosa TaxID=2045280 RepID=A0A455T3N0_9CHLR|nr:glycosyl transferase [Thermogemmatispora argillosa]
MRIMIVTDQYPPMVGGVPVVTHDLAVGLAARGHQVWVVAPCQGARDVHRIEEGVHVYRFTSFEWPTYPDMRIPFLPILPIRRLLKQSNPDVIHIHSPIVLGNIAQLLAGGLRKPVIATNHYLPINISRTLASDQRFSKHFDTLSYSYLIHFYNRCEYVTTPTHTALRLLYEHGLRAPAGVISNGVDLKKFAPGPPDEEVRQRYHLPADRPLVLHVNRLSEEKRVNVLLDAVAQLKHRAYVVLAGTGPAEAELREQAARLRIEEHVAFLGFVADRDLLAIRRMADLFVIPSEADLQSLATMEAMACGLPVIAANAYALPELVHHGENGLLFEPGNSGELARAIDYLLEHPELRRQMGAKSLEIIAQHDRERVLDQWEALYQRLASEFAVARQLRERARRALRLRRPPLPSERG